MSAASAPTFTGMALDRAATLRKRDDWVRARLADEGAQAVAASREGVLLHGDGEVVLSRRPLSALGTRATLIPEPILLGLEEGAPLFAIDLEALDAASHARLTQGSWVASLRDAGAMLSAPEGGLGAYLMALLNWHRRHRFCANCGAATTVSEGGYARSCPRCTATHFPRTDPVVIMIVESDAGLLLGRQASWPAERYSALAGFVSPGESVEEAVGREVREESGIVARDPRFVASQPWPFPASLMLGFQAVADGGEPRVRDGELEDVRWFSRDELRAARAEPTEPAERAGPAGPRLQLPPSVAIARFLIDHWLDNPRA